MAERSRAEMLAARLANGRRRTAFVAAALAGMLAATGQAPLGAWPASLVGFALVIGLFLSAGGWRRAAWLGWAAGTGYFAAALHWIVEPFMVDIARHGWMAPFALFFMAAGLGLFWALAAGVAARAPRRALALVATLTLTEALRGVIFTGFPWAQPGHIWIGTALMPLAAWGGALLLTAITMAAGALIWQALCVRRGPAVFCGVGLAILVPWPAPAPVPLPSEAPVIRLVQPNAAQHQKWDPEMIPVFYRRQVEYTAQAPKPDLIVWPETAIPVLLNNAEPTLRAISRAAGGAPVVLGVQRFDGPRLLNSMVAVGSDGGVTALYDKHYLVPFGEYLPFGRFLKRFGLRGLAAEDGNGYASGPGPQVMELGALGAALPLICYEGVFPFNISGAPARPDFLLLITNDAWFGQVSGPYQHLAQARLRSVEQGLPMIRVANTGISAMIDAQGLIRHSLPLGQAGYVDAALPPPAPPTLYARTGDWPMLALILLALGGAFATSRRKDTVSD